MSGQPWLLPRVDSGYERVVPIERRAHFQSANPNTAIAKIFYCRKPSFVTAFAKGIPARCQVLQCSDRL
jgi:hypothetical protein